MHHHVRSAEQEATALICSQRAVTAGGSAACAGAAAGQCAARPKQWERIHARRVCADSCRAPRLQRQHSGDRRQHQHRRRMCCETYELRAACLCQALYCSVLAWLRCIFSWLRTAPALRLGVSLPFLLFEHSCSSRALERSRRPARAPFLRKSPERTGRNTLATSSVVRQQSHGKPSLGLIRFLPHPVRVNFLTQLVPLSRPVAKRSA